MKLINSPCAYRIQSGIPLAVQKCGQWRDHFGDREGQRKQQVEEVVQVAHGLQLVAQFGGQHFYANLEDFLEKNKIQKCKIFLGPLFGNFGLKIRLKNRIYGALP